MDFAGDFDEGWVLHKLEVAVSGIVGVELTARIRKVLIHVQKDLKWMVLICNWK